MIGTRTKPSTKGSKAAPAADDVVGIFLTPNGRLPDFAQRRLDALIAKKRLHGLTRAEQRELSEALDYIDTKTVEMLEHALSSQSPHTGGRAGRTAARAPKGAARRDEAARQAGGAGRPSGGPQVNGGKSNGAKVRRGDGLR